MQHDQFNLTVRSRSPYSAEISSTSGAIMRQGPHQGAQKSTCGRGGRQGGRGCQRLSRAGEGWSGAGVRDVCGREVAGGRADETRLPTGSCERAAPAAQVFWLTAECCGVASAAAAGRLLSSCMLTGSRQSLTGSQQMLPGCRLRHTGCPPRECGPAGPAQLTHMARCNAGTACRCQAGPARRSA